MFCLFASSSFCQKKAFKTALSVPREPGKGYRMNYPREYNTREQATWKMRDYNKYIKKNEFIVIYKRYNYKNSIDEYDYVDFVPKTEYTQYIMENLNNCKPINNLVNQGSAYFFKPDAKNPFIEIENVRWSGQINDGKIQGDGFGIAMVNEHEYYRIQGKFVDGFLQGPGEFSYYQESDYGGYDKVKKLKINKIEIGAYADGMFWIKIKDKYGYLSSDYKIAIPPSYDGASDFAKGIAIVKTGTTDFKINKKGETLGLADNTQFTYKQAVEMKKTQPHLEKQMEEWVSNFIDQSKTYNDLIGIEKDFPSLANKADKRRKEIYLIDCKQIKELLEEAKQKSSNNEFAKAGKREYADNFVSTYTKHNYDPDNIMPLAKEFKRYYDVWKEIEDYDRTTFIEYKGTPFEEFFGINSFTIPVFRNDWAQKKSKEIKNAMEICQSPGRFGLDNFYKKANDSLTKKYETLQENIRKSSDDYHKEMRKIYDENRKLREYIKNKEDKAARTKIPNYKISGWEKHSLISPVQCPEWTYVEYDDHETGFIGRYKNGTYCANSSNKDYKTFYDAVAAEYIFRKFNVIREEGLIK